jgi:hypothetical protein
MSDIILIVKCIKIELDLEVKWNLIFLHNKFVNLAQIRDMDYRTFIPYSFDTSDKLLKKIVQRI